MRMTMRRCAVAVAAIALGACNLDLQNPNSPTEGEVTTSVDGVIALATGLQNRYSQSYGNFAYMAGLVTDEFAAVSAALVSISDAEQGLVAPGQFNTVHSLQVDAQGMVYVADRANNRIQVFDNDGNFKAQYRNVGSPWTLCITPGPHQYLYSSNSNYPNDFENGEIYKMELDGKILGKFGKAGKALKEHGSLHAMDCRTPNTLYTGDLTNWRVQKLTLHPTAAQGTN